MEEKQVRFVETKVEMTVFERRFWCFNSLNLLRLSLERALSRLRYRTKPDVALPIVLSPTHLHRTPVN